MKRTNIFIETNTCKTFGNSLDNSGGNIRMKITDQMHITTTSRIVVTHSGVGVNEPAILYAHFMYAERVEEGKEHNFLCFAQHASLDSFRVLLDISYDSPPVNI